MDFKNHLLKYLSEEEITRLLGSLKQEPKYGVLLNTRKMSDETFLSLFPHVIKHPIVPHAYLYDKNEYQLGKSVYHALGCFYLQEPSAMLPAYYLNANENDVVLDLCAAPGGKTVQTSFLMNNKGIIISNDISRQRASKILENVERLGIGNTIITANDFSLIFKDYLDKFDKIILDAPCSGSGMFRKEEKMADDWSYNKVLKNQEIQKQLIYMAYQMLKPGGTMVYSTCSFSYEEDEEVIDYLLAQSDAKIINITNPLLYINKINPLGVHLFPHLFPGEGHYLCLLEKSGMRKENKEDSLKTKNKYNLEFNNVFDYSHILFGIDKSINVKPLNIIRLGVKIGEDIKGEIKFDYHYAHYINKFEKIKEINDEEIKKYFLGETILDNDNKGYILIKYKGINVDIAKGDGRIIKNHLPKGLRYKL